MDELHAMKEVIGVLVFLVGAFAAYRFVKARKAKNSGVSGGGKDSRPKKTQ